MATINKAVFSYEFRGVLEQQTRVRIRAGDAGTGPVEIELEIDGRFARATVPHFEWITALHTMALMGINPLHDIAFAFDGVSVTETTGADMAVKFGEQSVELAKARGLEGRPSHAMWGEIKHHAAVGFFVGWYAGRGRRLTGEFLAEEFYAFKGGSDGG